MNSRAAYSRLSILQYSGLQWHFHRVAPRPLIPAQMEFGNEDKERREKLDN